MLGQGDHHVVVQRASLVVGLRITTQAQKARLAPEVGQAVLLGTQLAAEALACLLPGLEVLDREEELLANDRRSLLRRVVWEWTGVSRR